MKLWTFLTRRRAPTAPPVRPARCPRCQHTPCVSPACTAEVNAARAWLAAHEQAVRDREKAATGNG
jgi:hypothetical protein